MAHANLIAFDEVTKLVDRQNSVDIANVDFSEAFDKIGHNFLFLVS